MVHPAPEYSRPGIDHSAHLHDQSKTLSTNLIERTLGLPVSERLFAFLMQIINNN